MGKAFAFLSLATILGVLGAGLAGCGPGAQVTLNVATAGDTNMVELQKNVFGPEFVKKYPNVTVNTVGTGPGDPGSRSIYDKLKAQSSAGKKSWDIDVGVIHQSIMAEMLKDGLLLQYVPKTTVAKYVVASDAKNALGTNVEGYVIPMFHSQTAIAYNPKYVPTPPKNFEELVAWAKANPKKFGYNGIKGGMSGQAFVAAWTYWKTGKYDVYAKGPYDKANEAPWPAVLKELKAFNEVATITAGNAGTLDMLNRGEIYMGAVWVDMFVLWKNEGRMDPSIQVTLPDPGMPGQPMYLVIPKEAANKDMAQKFIEMIASPEQQAKVIVERNGWYPGIDAKEVLPKVSKEGQDKLFKGVTPDDLAKKGLVFPLTDYFKDLLTAYEDAMK
ncbi:MAG: extracellular solute-binding protein [Chloroflexota bacterium]